MAFEEKTEGWKAWAEKALSVRCVTFSYLFLSVGVDLCLADPHLLPVWLVTDMLTASLPLLGGVLARPRSLLRVMLLVFLLLLPSKCLLPAVGQPLLRWFLPLSTLAGLGLFQLLPRRKLSRQSHVPRLQTEEMQPPLFERLLDYMESQKPFLSSNLSMDELARAVLTNRQYLSRSINLQTGLHFCRFVNYYRVRHAVLTYDWSHPERMDALSERCGFNTPVSFTAAFKLVTGEKPSVWFSLGRQPFPSPEEYLDPSSRKALSMKLGRVP